MQAVPGSKGTVKKAEGKDLARPTRGSSVGPPADDVVC